MQNFLPSDYTMPEETKGQYIKLKEGQKRLRILSKSVVWWIDWDNQKPIRTKNKPETSIDPKKPAKHFWAFKVYDCDENEVKIWEVTQKSIMDQLINLTKDEDFSDIFSYDLKIKREGKEKDNTKYFVTPWVVKPLDEEMQKKADSTPVNLEVLMEGRDPFAKDSNDEVVF